MIKNESYLWNMCAQVLICAERKAMQKGVGDEVCGRAPNTIHELSDNKMKCARMNMGRR